MPAHWGERRNSSLGDWVGFGDHLSHTLAVPETRLSRVHFQLLFCQGVQFFLLEDFFYVVDGGEDRFYHVVGDAAGRVQIENLLDFLSLGG